MIFRKCLLTLFLLLLSTSIFTQTKFPKDEVSPTEVEFIRITFYEAVESSGKNDELLDYINVLLDKSPSKKPVFLLAYQGASETLIAKHSYNPYTKWNYLNKGLEKIGGAIEKYKESLELRFLRFSILHYLPGFLGFAKERNEDLNYVFNLLLQKDYSEIDNSVQEGIITFLIESERLNAHQVRKLQSLLLAEE